MCRFVLRTLAANCHSESATADEESPSRAQSVDEEQILRFAQDDTGCDAIKNHTTSRNTLPYLRTRVLSYRRRFCNPSAVIGCVCLVSTGKAAVFRSRANCHNPSAKPHGPRDILPDNIMSRYRTAIFQPATTCRGDLSRRSYSVGGSSSGGGSFSVGESFSADGSLWAKTDLQK